MGNKNNHKKYYSSVYGPYSGSRKKKPKIIARRKIRKKLKKELLNEDL
jgi:hypothetical protein